MCILSRVGLNGNSIARWNADMKQTWPAYRSFTRMNRDPLNRVFVVRETYQWFLQANPWRLYQHLEELGTCDRK